MDKSIKFMGLEFSSEDLAHLVGWLTIANPRRGTAFHLVNAHSLVLANDSPKLFSLFKEDVLICDGKPLALLLRRKASNLAQIRGADLMRKAIVESTPSVRHYFFGSTNEVLARLIAYAQKANPEICIAGSHSPDFTEDYIVLIPLWLRKIRESKATIVWVGLGTPKQDYVAHEIAKQIPAHCVAIGAAFDFLSGNIAEAPKCIQVLGLEWFYRLLKEPRRLAKRYLVGNIKFLGLIVRDFFLHK